MLPDLRGRKSIGDEVYEAVKKCIINRDFEPGQHLQMSDIERQMGVSRTPLKEALSRLAIEGLVEVRARKGTYVTNPTAEEIAQKCEVRRILETRAFELAAERMTREQLQQIRDILQETRRLIGTEGWAGALERCAELDLQMIRLLMDFAGNIPLKNIWEQVNIHAQEARALHALAAEGRIAELEEGGTEPKPEGT